MLVENSRL